LPRVWVVKVLEEDCHSSAGQIKEFSERDEVKRATTGTEAWVTSEMLRYLSQLFSKDNIYFGEVPLTQGRCGPQADIVIGHLTDIDIAIECKGSEDHKEGVGKAMVYNQFADHTGLAVYEGESYIRDTLFDAGVSFWSFESTRMTTMDDSDLL